MQLEEKGVASKLIYDGRVVHLYEDEVLLPDGKAARREYVKHIGAVCVLALNNKGEVILERQFRYPFHTELIEIPAGKLDSADEDPTEAALRELREETGYVPERITYLGDYFSSPAILDERIRIFFAEGLHRDAQHLDEDEFLEVFTMPLEELVAEILAGRIPDGKTQAAALRVYTMLQQKGNAK